MGGGHEEGIKRLQKEENNNKKAKLGESKGEGGKDEASMEHEAQRLKEVGNAAALQVEQRAQEAKARAEATLEELICARVKEVEVQARLGWREFFEDLVMDGTHGDKIFTSWLAQCTAKYGF